MILTVTGDDGDPIEFDCADTLTSRWVSQEILSGKTYPYLPFVDDVRVVLDVGANCGATTVHLARHYPDAAIHSFEPGSTARGFLERNAARFPNVHVHPVGLSGADGEAPLYFGDDDIGKASLHHRGVNLGDSELVAVRSGGAWAAEHDIDRIDVLKVDVEGAEVEVITSLAHLLPTVKILYLEYDSRQARHALAGMLEATHELYVGLEFLDQGEVIYLRRDLADRPEAADHLRDLFVAALAAR